MAKKSGRPRLYTCNENIFKEESERAFYLAGFIAADGTLVEQKYNKRLKIALSGKDRAHLEKIRDVMESNHYIGEYKVKPNKLTRNKTHFTSCEMYITSSIIFDDLAKFNIVPNKTYIYTFPEWLVNHPLVHHFMRGYVDGDGSICASRKIRRLHPDVSFSLIGQYDFIKTFGEILAEKCRFALPKITKQSDNLHRIRSSGNKQMLRLYEFMYGDATIYLDRKHDKIKMLKQNNCQMELTQ